MLTAEEPTLKAVFSIDIRKDVLISHKCPIGFEKMVSSYSY